MTDVLAEICMSAGPKSVAPVSRPATVTTADIIRCSMNGRAMMISIGSQSAFSLLMAVLMAAIVFGTSTSVPMAALETFFW